MGDILLAVLIAAFFAAGYFVADRFVHFMDGHRREYRDPDDS